MITSETKGAPDTKRRIFEAALRVFSEKGYDGTTMDEVIAAAGVSKGSIYWHFSSKKELFEELFEFWFEGVMQMFLEQAAEGAPWDKIQTFVHESYRLLLKDAGLFRAFIEFFNIGMKDEKFKERLKHYYVSLTCEMEAVIIEGKEYGDFTVRDTKNAAIAIFALLDGLVMRALLDPQELNEESMFYVKRFIANAIGYRVEQEEGK